MGMVSATASRRTTILRLVTCPGYRQVSRIRISTGFQTGWIATRTTTGCLTGRRACKAGAFPTGRWSWRRTIQTRTGTGSRTRLRARRTWMATGCPTTAIWTLTATGSRTRRRARETWMEIACLTSSISTPTLTGFRTRLKGRRTRTRMVFQTTRISTQMATVCRTRLRKAARKAPPSTLTQMGPRISWIWIRTGTGGRTRLRG
mmetsp:Transcript_36803/g.83677  ORF Transcript_36803/g.83677 Transcript_36803/m.83677 type:complete len:204 (+) Transcript_36803:1674-2285(+)